VSAINFSSEHLEYIELNEDCLIGTGSRRFCYLYPERPDLCIKIPKPKRNGYLQQRREVRYYRKLSKKKAPTTHITRYHGTVPTSLGTGYIYDAIRDFDGSVSTHLIDYFRDEPERVSEYLTILKQLECYLFENYILIYDLSAWNILCRKNEDGSLHPYIIDGIGDVVAIPILNLSKVLLRQKLTRRWLRMIRQIAREFDWIAQYQGTYYQSS